MASDGYLEVIAFLPKRDGGKRPQRCGRAKIKDDGSVQLWLDVVPTAGWDGSFLCSAPREQDQQQQQRAPQAAAPRSFAAPKPQASHDNFGPPGGDFDDQF